jgi:hypothetical protein
MRANWKAGLWVTAVLCLGGMLPGVEARATADEQAPPQSYTKAVETFMEGAEARELYSLVREAFRDARDLNREQREHLVEIRRRADDVRPDWWENAKSPSNISFRASMWGKSFTANYYPSEMMGVQAPIGMRGNRLIIIVSWRPSYVDNPRPLGGWLAEKHGLTRGDLGEVIVWHELGHNYISMHLSARDNLTLYRNHRLLYSHVQEFYADLTALRHASAGAARTALMFRLRELTHYEGRAPHTRAAHALGALMLTEWLEHPDDWPMVHFPPEVPEQQVELNAIRYIYQHFEPEWSVGEYFRLHDFLDHWVRRHGDRVLRGRGHVRLPNGLEMHLIEPRDREAQAERDAWVAAKLRSIIDAGRADAKLSEAERERWEEQRRGEVTLIGPNGEPVWNGIEIPW